MTTKPSLIVVGSLPYDIQYDKNLGSLGAAGMTNSDNLMMGIDSNLASTIQKLTLVHEILHGAWRQTSLLVRYPDEDKDSKGEKIIQDLTTPLFQVFQDERNKEAIRWLSSP